MQIPKIIFKLLDKIDDSTLEKYTNESKQLTKKLFKAHYRFMLFSKKLATNTLIYVIMAGIFIYIYMRVGFEITLIILLVGVINYSIKRG